MTRMTKSISGTLMGVAITGGVLLVVAAAVLLLFELGSFSYRAFTIADLPGVWRGEVVLEEGGAKEVELRVEGSTLVEFTGGTMRIEDVSSGQSRTLALDADAGQDSGFDFSFSFQAGGEGTPSPLVTISGERVGDKLEESWAAQSPVLPLALILRRRGFAAPLRIFAV